jgi:hypothetical protein
MLEEGPQLRAQVQTLCDIFHISTRVPTRKTYVLPLICYVPLSRVSRRAGSDKLRPFTSVSPLVGVWSGADVAQVNERGGDGAAAAAAAPPATAPTGRAGDTEPGTEDDGGLTLFSSATRCGAAVPAACWQMLTLVCRSVFGTVFEEQSTAKLLPGYDCAVVFAPHNSDPLRRDEQRSLDATPDTTHLKPALWQSLMTCVCLTRAIWRAG